jgi:proteasome lid subunit RPN8/RPN11
MLAHVMACLPEEACGLVGSPQSDGPAGPSPVNGAQTIEAVIVLPVENELHSQVRFRMAPAEQLKAFYRLEEQKLELAAIYHSHPQGPVHPSATDLAEFAYPGVWMVILSPLDPALSKHTPPLKNAPAVAAAVWQARVFRIDNGLSSGLTASEVPLVLLPEPQRGAS